MSTEKVFEFTKQGLEDAKEKLEIMKTKTRKEVSEKIKEARSFGDLSENAEYDEAKNEQAEVEAEIMKLEEMIKYAKVVEEDESKSDMVTPGSRVTVHDFELDEDDVYTIVGSMEADLENGKLSYESPIGAALLNKKVGDTVEVKVFDEPATFKILKIEK
ncbi:MAG: transcription elongation factor GreA [Clostridia bacterium]|nr:transcription elongation factor GreA [Clostridia bacterium]